MYVFLTIKLSKYNNTSSLFECKHTLLGRRIKDTQNVQEPLESLILTNFCIKPCLSFYNQDLWAKNHVLGILLTNIQLENPVSPTLVTLRQMKNTTSGFIFHFLLQL